MSRNRSCELLSQVRSNDVWSGYARFVAEIRKPRFRLLQLLLVLVRFLREKIGRARGSNQLQMLFDIQPAQIV